VKTLNQERGQFALNEVSKIKGEGGKAKKYKSYAKKLPAFITTNGTYSHSCLFEIKE